MMSASELRTLRHLALTIASATSAMIELLEQTDSSETSGAKDGAAAAGTTPAQGTEAAPDKLRFFGRKAADPSAAAASSGADETIAAD